MPKFERKTYRSVTSDPAIPHANQRQRRDRCDRRSSAAAPGGRCDDGIMCRSEITSSQAVLTPTMAIAARLRASTDEHIWCRRDCLWAARLRSWKCLKPCFRIPQAVSEMPEDAAAVQETTRLGLDPTHSRPRSRPRCQHYHSTPFPDDKDLHGAPDRYGTKRPATSPLFLRESCAPKAVSAASTMPFETPPHSLTHNHHHRYLCRRACGRYRHDLANDLRANHQCLSLRLA
ncbi:hypothetical protein FANTH_7800 [Fusarium anthophilum]|uniref:Uncharacterized protein n=1 Tax=Fusarium anthophilum TaxID=48485 RepID=A0A8H4ZEC7_9HYPO|nr:hypothetical protein FANTH_7800 [Fusarium anthophilum]